MLLVLVNLLGLESDQAKGVLVMSVIYFVFMVVVILALLFVKVVGRND